MTDKDHLIFIFIIFWCILVLIYSIVWKHNFMAFLSAILLLIKIYMQNKGKKKSRQ